MNRETSPAELDQVVRDAHERAVALVADLADDQMLGPRMEIVNPPLWEIGHVGWFLEKWGLRHLGKEKPIRADGDLLYDSARVPHDARWELPLPSREETFAYVDEVVGRTRERLASVEPDPLETYFHYLGIFHTDMHAEAFTYTRQTLEYPAPGPARQEMPESPSGGGSLPGDVEVPGETYPLGATPEIPFVFDNEKWAHPVALRDFRIARAPVTNGEFAAFVDAGGYRRAEFWSPEGWSWRGQEAAEHPVYWRRGDAGRWWQRRFQEWVPLPEHEPVIHVNWYEAQAYCRWAGRRLPSEAEWETAAGFDPEAGRKRRFPWGEEPPSPERANLDGRVLGCVEVGSRAAGDSAWGCRQMIGNVWEWTGTTFGPYPGFVVDPYKEYSQPWFGTRKVLRGGCWATRSRLIRTTWRNYFTPDRRDVLAGFRTCAL